jgi:hypothetical protein
VDGLRYLVSEPSYRPRVQRAYLIPENCPMHTTIFFGMMNDGKSHEEAAQHNSTPNKHNHFSSSLNHFSWCLGTRYGQHRDSVAFLRSSK